MLSWGRTAERRARSAGPEGRPVSRNAESVTSTGSLPGRGGNRPLGGGLSEFVVLVPGTVWFRLPDEVPDRVAAPANCATATVAALLRHGGRTRGMRLQVPVGFVIGLPDAAEIRLAFDAGRPCHLALTRCLRDGRRNDGAKAKDAR